MNSLSGNPVTADSECFESVIGQVLTHFKQVGLKVGLFGKLFPECC